VCYNNNDDDRIDDDDNDADDNDADDDWCVVSGTPFRFKI